MLLGMGQLALIALAGAAGTLCRHGLTVWTYRAWGPAFPYGTLLANVLGCLVIGAFVGVWRSVDAVPDAWRLPIAVGFCGGFTTMSSFAYETLRYAERGAWRTAGLNVVVSLVLSFAAVAAGATLTRALIGRAES